MILKWKSLMKTSLLWFKTLHLQIPIQTSMEKNSQIYRPISQTMNITLKNWAWNTHRSSPCPSRSQIQVPIQTSMTKKSQKLRPNYQLMKYASTNWALPTSTKLIHQWNDMKRNWTHNLKKILIISKLSHLAPSIRHLILQIHTTIIIIPTKLQLISLHSHLWIYKATPFFNFKSGGIPFVLPYTNLCRQNRSGKNTINLSKIIMTSSNFSSH